MQRRFRSFPKEFIRLRREKNLYVLFPINARGCVGDSVIDDLKELNKQHITWNLKGIHSLYSINVLHIITIFASDLAWHCLLTYEERITQAMGSRCRMKVRLLST